MDELHSEADDEGQPERERESQADSRRGTPELSGVDLEAGQEEQEPEPEQRQHVGRHVDLDPVETRRPHDDPEDDLDHDRREPQRGRELDQQRRRKRDDRDDEDRAER